jgi:hypothetical protein
VIILSEGSIVNKVFSIFSASVGSLTKSELRAYLMNGMVELIHSFKAQ